MKALELLRAHVNVIPPNATMQDMVDILDLYQVLLLPVVDDDGLLLGSVYEEQIVSAMLDASWFVGLTSEERRAHIDAARGMRACDIMVAPAPFADEHEDVLECLTRMADAQVTRLPVTSNGRVVGTISRVDICQAGLEGEL